MDSRPYVAAVANSECTVYGMKLLHVVVLHGMAGSYWWATAPPHLSRSSYTMYRYE